MSITCGHFLCHVLVLCRKWKPVLVFPCVCVVVLPWLLHHLRGLSAFLNVMLCCFSRWQQDSRHDCCSDPLHTHANTHISMDENWGVFFFLFFPWQPDNTVSKGKPESQTSCVISFYSFLFCNFPCGIVSNYVHSSSSLVNRHISMSPVCPWKDSNLIYLYWHAQAQVEPSFRQLLATWQHMISFVTSVIITLWKMSRFHVKVPLPQNKVEQIYSTTTDFEQT